MPTEPVVDIERLVQPISEDTPVGKNPMVDRVDGSAFEQAQDARDQAATMQKQLMEGDPDAAPDWQAVVYQSSVALQDEAKDLRLAAWLTEALTYVHGFAGFRDGYTVIQQLIEQYWEDLYPKDDDDDEDPRRTLVAPLTSLTGTEEKGVVLRALRTASLTPTSQTKMTLLDHIQAEQIEMIADPDQKRRRLESGAVSLDAFESTLQSSSASFGEELNQDLEAAITTFNRVDDMLSERCGYDEYDELITPPSSDVRNALKQAQELVVRGYRLGDGTDDESTTTGEGEADALSDTANVGSATSASAGTAVPGQINTREDAFKALDKVARFFQKTEPHSPVSYLIDRAIKWGRLPLPELLNEIIADETSLEQVAKLTGVPKLEQENNEYD